MRRCARTGEAEAAQRCRKQVIDPIERIIDAVGVLEHRLDIVAKGPSPVPIEGAQIGATVADLAAAGLGEAEQQAGERGLARATFPHYGDDRRLLGIDRQR